MMRARTVFAALSLVLATALAFAAVAAACPPPGNGAATITGSFSDRCRDFAARSSKEPFAPELKLNARIKREAMQRGLMVYPMGGTIDGVRGDHVLLAPPFIVNAEQIDTIVERLGDCRANPSACARHERAFSCQRHCRLPFCSDRHRTT